MGERAFTYYSDPTPIKDRAAVCRKAWCDYPATEDDLCGVHLLEQRIMRDNLWMDPKLYAQAMRSTNPKKVRRKR